MIAPIAASFLLCLLATFALRPVAIALKLIDRPGGRKKHHGEVPIVGGLAMLIGLVFGLGFVPLSDASATPFLAACALLVTIGLLDDRFDLSPWLRLPVHSAAALLLIGSGVSVATLGAPFGGEHAYLSGLVADLVTVLVVVASINAFNMLDGLDGLAGAMGIVALSMLAFLMLDVGAVVLATAALTVVGAVAAFLVANVPARFNRDVRCFMGDSGSTLLGFTVAALGISACQPPVHAAAPVTLLWIVALPLFDFSWSILRRLLRGTSPLRPDHEHLHHCLLKAGFGVRGAFAAFVVLSALLAGAGIVLDRTGVSDGLSLLLLAGTGIVVVRLLYRAHALCAWLPEWHEDAELKEDPDSHTTDT